jgi:hypothetical protein
VARIGLEKGEREEAVLGSQQGLGRQPAGIGQAASRDCTLANLVDVIHLANLVGAMLHQQQQQQFLMNHGSAVNATPQSHESRCCHR